MPTSHTVGIPANLGLILVGNIMQNLVANRTTAILGKLGFEASIKKSEKDKVIALVESKFFILRRALSKQYGRCAHNVTIPGGRRATWFLEGKGTLIAKSVRKGIVQVTFATMPFLR
jgi:hypothetical protein